MATGAQATNKETVAVLGAGGAMGFRVARSLTMARIPVRAWDRMRGLAQPLAGLGATVTETAAEAAEGAGIVLTAIEDPKRVLELMEAEVLPVMRRSGGESHAIWLQMAPLEPGATSRCIRLANSVGVGFVDAPAIGTNHDADRGMLVILESGPEQARPRVQPLFDVIGRRTVRLGEAGEATRRRAEFARLPTWRPRIRDRCVKRSAPGSP
jgi:3-hydroxyisobutyrate dehydrogenase